MTAPSALQTTTMPSVKGRFGSKSDLRHPSGLGLECAAEPTFAVVALLHLKRTAAISAVEGHLIERVNGGLGPIAEFWSSGTECESA